MLNLVISQDGRNSYEICFDIHHENKNEPLNILPRIFASVKEKLTNSSSAPNLSKKVFNMENIRYKRKELLLKKIITSFCVIINLLSVVLNIMEILSLCLNPYHEYPEQRLCYIQCYNLNL